MLRRILLAALLMKMLVTTVQSFHIQGSFSNSDFFLFLAKFGFQKARDDPKDPKQATNSQGYIYGNITTSGDSTGYDVYLVVVDSERFVDFYGHRNYRNVTTRCSKMFTKIDELAWDNPCKISGVEDFLRRVPCESGKICIDEQNAAEAVLPGFQFTYRVADNHQPRFWYISLVACHRPRVLNTEAACQWSYNETVSLSLSYDIWFVNGYPENKLSNPFEHQFSFEMHDVWEIYMTFLVINGFLLAVSIWVFRGQQHMLISLILTILALEVCGMTLNVIHMSVFALDGVGVPFLVILGNLIEKASQCVTMLELLLIAKGWRMTNPTLDRKLLLLSIWIIYSAIYVVLFIFTLVFVDPIGDKDEWQTVPGYLILIFRILIMVYFLYELRKTFALEKQMARRMFYTRFGAGFLVWFIYLPIVALISPKIAALWRFKTLLSIQSGADFIFSAILVHLFWPAGEDSNFNIPIPALDGSKQHERSELLSSSEESSEDELYERQASLTNHVNDHEFSDEKNAFHPNGYHTVAAETEF